MSIFTNELDGWISQELPSARPTEIFVPVQMEICPVWAHMDQPPQCWCAVLAVPSMDVALFECAHHHGTQDEAWACAETHARALAQEVLRDRRT